MGSGLGRADEGGPAARRKPRTPNRACSRCLLAHALGLERHPPSAARYRERRVTGPVSTYDLALENPAEADRD